jgi:hypothetical protein
MKEGEAASGRLRLAWTHSSIHLSFVIKQGLRKGNARSNRLATSVQLSRTLETHSGHQSIGSTEKREKTIVFDPAVTDSHLITVSDFAGDRDAQIKLIRPDIRDRRIFDGLPVDDALRDHFRLFDGARPMFEARSIRIIRVFPTRAIAEGEYARPTGKPRRIATHTVVDLESGALQPLRRRRRPHPDDHALRRQQGSVRETDASHAPRSFESFDAHVEMKDDTLSTMASRDTLAENRTKPSNQRGRQGIDNDHFEALRAATRGDFHADESGADHDDARRTFDGRTKGPGIGQSSKGEDPVEILTKGQPSRPSTRREHDRIGTVDSLAIGEHESERIFVERNGFAAKLPIGLQFAHFAPPKRELLLWPILGQELFRKRRPVIGHLFFGPDHRDATAKCFSSKRFRRSQSRKRGTDDYNMVDHGSRFSL